MGQGDARSDMEMVRADEPVNETKDVEGCEPVNRRWSH